jgi:hypothetical protein
VYQGRCRSERRLQLLPQWDSVKRKKERTCCNYGDEMREQENRKSGKWLGTIKRAFFLFIDVYIRSSKFLQLWPPRKTFTGTVWIHSWFPLQKKHQRTSRSTVGIPVCILVAIPVCILVAIRLNLGRVRLAVITNDFLSCTHCLKANGGIILQNCSLYSFCILSNYEVSVLFHSTLIANTQICFLEVPSTNLGTAIGYHD